MRTPRTRLLRTGAVASLTLAVAVATAAPGQAAGVDDPTSRVEKAPAQTAQTDEVKDTKSGDKLGQADRELLEDAKTAGTKRVTVMLATDREQTASVVKSLEAAGAWVGTVNDKLGYVRASVPTAAVDKIAGLSRVQDVDLDQSVPLEPSPATQASTAGSAPSAAPGAKTPDANPYMPTQDTGSIDFRKKNPTYDGRGVTIGIVDSGVDLDHPALQTTTTGERKIVDWVTGTDPLLDDDLSWRPMITTVTATPQFTAANQTWTAPRAGSFKFNRFNEVITAASEPAGDINRDGDTSDSFGILYDSATNDIWVDANQDNAFTASELMRPYKEKFQIGHFGTDNPATPLVERTPFVVEFREDVSLAPAGQPGVADFVNIGLVEDAHGSHVAGITAAHAMFGGTMNGQAPGAKLISSRACTWGGGCTAAALLDGVVDLVSKRGVDVVNISIGGLPALNDANNARATVYDRLIDDYGVQIFISAGNSGPGLNTIGDPSLISKVVSVASSISKETWKANYGSVVSAKQALHPFSSRGPTESGDFKPNISAPGSAISTVPQWLNQPGIAETGYTLPVGYAMFNGTSMASPQATGAAALLLSAAFQKDIAVTPKRLRDALYTAADEIDGESVAAQGTGLVNVPATWKILSGKDKAPVAEYTTDAPVCTPLSSLLKTPNRGTGLYNRCGAADGGQKVGVAKSYDLTITRTNGAAAATRHTVKIVGNDGTFKAPNTVSLAAGKPATVTVSANAKTPGVHSAYLEIDDPKTPVIDHRVMLSVVASEDLAAPSFSISKQGSTERNRSVSYFVTVPEGAKTLQVDLSGIATGSQTRFIAINPYGVPVESSASTACYTNFSNPATCNPQSRTYANPLPGVWEIELESRRTSPSLANPHSITASVQGVSVDPATQTVTPTADGAPIPVEWSVKNLFGATTVTPQGGPLGSALSERKTIADGDEKTFDVVVPEGASSLVATIGNPSDAGADLDLKVLNSAGDTVATSADGDSEESVTVANPAAGTYTVVIDGYAVPAGTTEYDYLDVFFAPSLGTLNVSGTPFALAAGATAKVSGTLAAAAAPSEGRSLFGRLQLLSPAGGVLGTADVVVGAAAPAAPEVSPAR